MLAEKMKNRRLVLASQSPRRRELLKGLDIDFRIAPDYSFEEVYPDTLPLREVPAYLSRLKTEKYPFRLERNEILLTSDTAVLAGDELLGKPKSIDEAKAMLGRLSGRMHEVISGVTLTSGSGRSRTFSSVSKVWFRPLEPDEIDYYAERYRPLDKAGAYAVQEWIGFVGIEKIEGSYYNIMGLPVVALYSELTRFIDDEA